MSGEERVFTWMMTSSRFLVIDPNAPYVLTSFRGSNEVFIIWFSDRMFCAEKKTNKGDVKDRDTCKWMIFYPS